MLGASASARAGMARSTTAIRIRSSDTKSSIRRLASASAFLASEFGQACVFFLLGLRRLDFCFRTHQGDPLRLLPRDAFLFGPCLHRVTLAVFGHFDLGRAGFLGRSHLPGCTLCLELCGLDSLDALGLAGCDRTSAL